MPGRSLTRLLERGGLLACIGFQRADEERETHPGQVRAGADLGALGHSLKEISLSCSFTPLLPPPFPVHSASLQHEQH